MKLSKHSIERMEERTELDKGNFKEFYRNALRKGKSWEQLKDGELKQFLKSREFWNCKVKYYKGYIFVYSRNSKQLYTMYEYKGEQNER